MVHPFLRRRNGQEKVSFPSDALGQGAGQDPGRAAVSGTGDADRHRRRGLHAGRGRPAAPRRWPRSRSTATSANFTTASCSGMLARGYDDDFAQRCFAQIEGFGSYGFPESHAASFALLVYASAWIKRHHPGIFACALLNSPADGLLRPRPDRARRARTWGDRAAALHQRQPLGQRDGMGGPARSGARTRPAPGLPPDQGHAPRRRRAGSPAPAATAITRSRMSGAAPGSAPPRWPRLAEADAFAALGLSRRDALWAAERAGRRPRPAAVRGRHGRRGDRRTRRPASAR